MATYQFNVISLQLKIPESQKCTRCVEPYQLLGLHVVEKLSGDYPGLLRMILRETVGKFVSGLFLGIGYFWAIWDKDAQAWHDKIAGTVVVRKL